MQIIPEPPKTVEDIFSTANLLPENLNGSWCPQMLQVLAQVSLVQGQGLEDLRETILALPQAETVFEILKGFEWARNFLKALTVTIEAAEDRINVAVDAMVNEVTPKVHKH